MKEQITTKKKKWLPIIATIVIIAAIIITTVYNLPTSHHNIPNSDESATEIEASDHEAVQKLSLMITVFDYMSSENYDSMRDVYGSDDTIAVRDILTSQEKRSYIYIPEDDGTHTGTGTGIYLFGNGEYYFYYGNFINGIREGHGIVFTERTKGYIYTFAGEWHNGEPNGIGTAYSERENGVSVYNGELVDGLWNGYVNRTWETYNGTFDLSFSAVNGIPDEVSEKEGYYRISQNDGKYTFELGRQVFSSPKYKWLDNDLDYGGEVLYNDSTHIDTVYSADIGVTGYLTAFDYHANSDENGAWWWTASIYGDTAGIVGFADNY